MGRSEIPDPLLGSLFENPNVLSVHLGLYCPSDESPPAPLEQCCDFRHKAEQHHTPLPSPQKEAIHGHILFYRLCGIIHKSIYRQCLPRTIADMGNCLRSVLDQR